MFLTFLPQNSNNIEINGCQSNFDSVLELYDFDNPENVIAFDDDGCGQSFGPSILTVNNLNASYYFIKLILRSSTQSEPHYELTLFCSDIPIEDPSQSPTTSPTASPTISPSDEPTDNPFGSRYILYIINWSDMHIISGTLPQII